MFSLLTQVDNEHSKLNYIKLLIFKLFTYQKKAISNGLNFLFFTIFSSCLVSTHPNSGSPYCSPSHMTAPEPTSNTTLHTDSSHNNIHKHKVDQDMPFCVPFSPTPKRLLECNGSQLIFLKDNLKTELVYQKGDCFSNFIIIFIK